MIENIIPTQNFEVVRDAIGSILLTELTNQKLLQGFDDDFAIYAERTVPIQNDDILTINVSLDSFDSVFRNQKDGMGRTVYNVDFYSNGTATGDQSGSENSSFRLHKFIGMSKYILSHTQYKTLELPLGIIGGTEVENFTIMDADLKQDSNFVRMGRLTIAVRLLQGQTMETGVLINQASTTVKLAETDLGFVYEFIN